MTRNGSRLSAPLLLCGLTLVAACESPPVVPTQDRRQNTQTSRIEGNLVVQGHARGNAVVLLYDAARPPPPQGTGRPLAFTLVSAEELFGSALHDGSSGPFTAPFTFSLVGPGRYLIQGFIDRDGCIPEAPDCVPPDFNPWFGVTGEPNAGDVGGAAVDATTRERRIFELTPREDGTLAPITGVTVSFTDAATVPMDRPVFEVTSGEPAFDPANGQVVLELSSVGLRRDAVSQPRPAFLVRFVDDDQDGVPDDANGDGIPDLWPRVIVRKLADAPAITDENVDRQGLLVSEGKDYERADGKVDGKPDAVVLAAGINPEPLLAALTNEDGSPKMTPVPVTKLQLVIRPLALDASNPAAPVPLKSVPSGRYAIIVMQFTGQTWRLPNELTPELAPTLGLPPIDGQGFTITVP